MTGFPISGGRREHESHVSRPFDVPEIPQVSGRGGSDTVPLEEYVEIGEPPYKNGTAPFQIELLGPPDQTDTDVPPVEAFLPLSPTEHQQAYRAARTASKDASVNATAQIAKTPELHGKWIANPYASDVQTQMEEQFPLLPTPSERARAVVLAEQKESYDRALAALPKEERTQRQLDSSADMTVRLTTFLNSHMHDFWDMSETEIYNTLIEQAFGTTDVDAIAEQYSRRQRRGFRLAAVNFIDDLQMIKGHKQELEANPKEVLSNYIGRSLDYDVQVEVLPIGAVFYCDRGDYIKIDQESEGAVLPFDSIPARTN